MGPTIPDDIQPDFRHNPDCNIMIEWMVAQTGSNPYRTSTTLVTWMYALHSMVQIHHTVGQGAPQSQKQYYV